MLVAANWTAVVELAEVPLVEGVIWPARLHAVMAVQAAARRSARSPRSSALGSNLATAIEPAKSGRDFSGPRPVMLNELKTVFPR